MKKIVSAPYIDQTARWVNGCESISSVMLLQAVGIPIDPDVFIERDLPHAPYWEQECIVQALQSALAHEGAADRFEVLDVSGETAAQLCRFIDEGMPVVFWATLDFTPVPEERDHWLLADGTDFAWKCHEHCLLLVGYDEENYWFNDPWHDHGVCAQPKELVERCHAVQDSYAVTLRRK